MPRFTETLKRLLLGELQKLRITAQVGFKNLGQTRVFRMYVIASAFRSMRYTERQELVWRIVRSACSEAQLSQISMIITATPSEIQDDEDAPPSVIGPRRR